MFEMMEAESIQVIPDGLDEMVPGPFLAAILSSIDVSALSGFDRVVVLGAHQRLVSHYSAQMYADMAAVSDSLSETEVDPEFVHEASAAEIRTALRLTRRTADFELGFAIDLRERLPQVWEALSAGDLDVRRARTIEAGTAHLDADTARAVVAKIIEAAPRLTTGQLAARIRRCCIQADPGEAAKRYDEAVSERRTVSVANETGTANLYGLDLAPEKVAAVTNRINYLARSLKTRTEVRTMDQLRADIYLDLLLGADTAGKGGVVDIHVDLDTLAELSQTPGELGGYGPVIADIARQTTAKQKKGEWRYTITDNNGQIIDSGTTRRRPTTSQRRQTETANPVCIFPGCRMPSTRCDLDHTKPWSEGGPTTVDNLPPVCRHDHVTRHKAHWTHQPLPNGDHQWTSPLGHTYTTSGKPP
jgi:hypothetical protein